MGEVIGVECSITIAGTTVPGILSGVGGALQYASRAILSSGPLVAGADQALQGYAPSTGAKSGIMVSFQIPVGSTGFVLAALAPAGVTVSLGFGAAGGVSLAGAICDSMTVQGSEGGDIQGSASFQSVQLPGAGSGNNSAGGDILKFNDVTSFTGAANHTDVNSFTWQVQRVLAAYRGNSPYGIPTKLKVARTEVFLSGEYLKEDEAEGAAQLVQPQALVNSSVIIGGNPLYVGQAEGSLTLQCLAALADAYPTVQGSFETYLTERSSFKSTTGRYS